MSYEIWLEITKRRGSRAGDGSVIYSPVTQRFFWRDGFPTYESAEARAKELQARRAIPHDGTLTRFVVRDRNAAAFNQNGGELRTTREEMQP